MDLDIEALNKIRVAMGEKPLPVPGASGPQFKEAKDDSSSDGEGSTLEKRQAKAGENWQKLQDEQKAKAARQARAEAIRKARDAAQRYAKLEGKGLGEEDEGDGATDTRTWLLQQKKRQKKLEKERQRRLEEELAEREKLASVQYTSADLAGVKVGHEAAQFDDGAGEQILTLKDAAVDAEDEDDELENLDLREREKLAERLELKKRKPVYNPNDVDDNGESSILAQYDEEINGKKRKRFTLDDQGQIGDDAGASSMDASNKSKGVKISLDLLDDHVPISDYKEEREVKIKKPKKKKSKTTRRRAEDDDESFPGPGENTTAHPSMEGSAMEVDSLPMIPLTAKPSKSKDDLVDDEDLQAQLALQRRAALKSRKKMRPEDLARQLREEKSATPGPMESNETPEDEPGLVIDETSEFIANLQKPAAPQPRQPTKSPRAVSRGVSAGVAGSPEPKDEDGDIDMEKSYNGIEDLEEHEARIKRETTTPGDVPVTGLEEESTIDRGIGATLSLLTQRGLLQKTEAEQLAERNRERQRFLAEKRRREEEGERKARAQREAERRSGRMDGKSAREREDEARMRNQQRDLVEARQMAEVMNREYKPNVELTYVDDFGRHMNQKEAFKHMSHKFHGKGSGKHKTEKHLKKIEDQKKKEAMSAFDNSQAFGMSGAVGTTAKKNRQAGVRLQ